MASVSSSRDLWNPRTVLDVDPMDPDCQCVGEASTTGRRCRWDFRSEQFNASQKAAAAKQLNSMAETHPSKVTSAALESLARNTLCRDWHKGQAYAKSQKWKAAIDSYSRQHGEQLTLAIAVGQLQLDLDDGKQLRSSIARERDAAEQEVKATRQALETSQTRCAELMEKIDRSDSQRKEDQAANSRGVARLRQQLTELRTSVKTLDQQLAASDREVAILKEAKAVEEGKTKLGEREAEGLRQDLRESKARYEALQAESSRETRRLEELLEAEREDKVAPPPPQKVKKGLFAVILRQPPRIFVRKASRMTKTESVPYVQSAA